MSSLGPEALKLIRAGQRATRPTSADRDRISLALRARMAGVVAPTLGTDVALAKSHGLGSSWPIASTIVVGLATGGLFIAGVHHTGKAPRATTTEPVAMTQPAVLAAPAAAPPPAQAEMVTDALVSRQKTETPVTAGVTRPRTSPSDRLAEEVEILARAQTELHAGHLAGTMRLLDEHARKFPRGALAQERRATRIRALCGMGRMAEAEAELARLAPGSVHEAGMREICAAKREAL